MVASDGVTTPSGGSPEDEFWRRPTPDHPAGDADSERTGDAASSSGRPATTAAGGYAGPPPTIPPPPGWRPPVHVQPAPPRRLPPQDMAAMDDAEQRAQRVTYGIGAVAAVVLVILTCLLCSRVLF